MVKIKVIHVDGWDHGWDPDDVMTLKAKSFTPKAVVEAILCCTEDCSVAELEEDQVEYFVERCNQEYKSKGVMSFMDEGDGYHCILMEKE